MTVTAMSTFEDGFGSLALEVFGNKRASILITAKEKDGLGVFYSEKNSNTEVLKQYTLKQILSADSIIPELPKDDIKKINEEVTLFIERCLKEKFLPAQYKKYLPTHSLSEEKTTEAAKEKSPVEIAAIIVAEKKQLWEDAVQDAKKAGHSHLEHNSPQMYAFFAQRISIKAREYKSTFHLLLNDPTANAKLIKDESFKGAVDTLLEADKRRRDADRKSAGSTGSHDSHASRPSSPRASSVTRVRSGSTDSQGGLFRTLSNAANNQSRPTSPRQGPQVKR